MCGIAGFCLTKHDARAIDSRVLAGMLLINIEHRGRHATGASWTETTPDGIGWWFAKAPVPARDFGEHIQQIPKHCRRALLHVRYATTGDPADNDNNHPIVVPAEDGGSIIGTHNGMFPNYADVMDDHDFEWIGEVDSQALFHLAGLDDFDGSEIEKLGGSGAWAYVHNSEPTTIHLGRTQGRPLWVTQTPSGSTLWCSELPALLEAMQVVGLKAEFEMEVPEWHTMTITDGRIDSILHIPRRQPRLSLLNSRQAQTVG